MNQKLRLAGVSQGCVNPGFLEGGIGSSGTHLWEDRARLKSARSAPVPRLRLPSE